MASGGRLGGDEAGFTLPELLIAATIALLVTAAGAMVVIMAVTSQPRTTERAGQIQQGRVMLESLTRELRQGESIVTATSSQLELLTYVSVGTCGAGGPGNAQLCRVSYSCGSSTCSRTETGPSGGATSTHEVVRGITGPNVFVPQGDPLDPTYVGVQLVFPQDSGDEAVTLEDGAALRNHAGVTGA